MAGNLDEYRIEKLRKKNIPADSFLVVTEGVASVDAPTLEIVYKLSQIEVKGKVFPKAKFSPGKISLPGKKQVFRVGDSKARFDCIGLENERLGEPLLIPFIQKGKQVTPLPPLDEIRSFITQQISLFPHEILGLEKTKPYPVKMSPGIQKLMKEIWKNPQDKN